MKQAGFSAVELLITLFVAFLFVMMGYQLYSVSLAGGSDANDQSKASDNAYYTLHKKIANGTYPCPTAPATYTETVENTTNGTTTTRISCPNSALTNLRQITVTTTYKNATASHGLYFTQN